MERGPPEDKQESGLLQSSSSSCRGSPEGYLRQHPLRLEGFSGAEHATSSASASASASASSDGRRSPPPAAPFAPRHDRPRRALKRDPMFPVLSKTRSEMLGSSESSEGNMESSSMSQQQQQQRQSSDEEFSRRDIAVENESLLPEILVPESESLYDELDDLIEDFDVLGTDAIEADAETETAEETDEEIGACGGRNLARRSTIGRGLTL